MLLALVAATVIGISFTVCHSQLIGHGPALLTIPGHSARRWQILRRCVSSIRTMVMTTVMTRIGRTNLLMLNLQSLVPDRKSIQLLNGKRCRIRVVIGYETKATASACVLFHHDANTEEVSIGTEELIHIQICEVVWDVKNEQVCSVRSLVRGCGLNWRTGRRCRIKLTTVWPHWRHCVPGRAYHRVVQCWARLHWTCRSTVHLRRRTSISPCLLMTKQGTRCWHRTALTNGILIRLRTFGWRGKHRIVTE
mmetsp:Transcript_7367/g.20904  ORF Transcript_7367/g.20904 Transcript_7367/m.20904 type:complete len:251 (-) Transcript_7367:1088-1840(-)